MKTPPTIYIADAFFSYKNNVIFENLNITLKSGQCTCLLGPSGVGKTTLLRFIANLHSDDSVLHGKITTDNNQPASQQIAYMAQTDLLLPWLTAIDNALLSERLTQYEKKYSQAIELFDQVGLKNAEKKYPHELSGGMRQRVALIRTLLQDKPVILMDEPFSSVDAITRFQLQSLAAQLLKNRTTLLITHDPLEALRLADEIYIMSGQPSTTKHILSLTSVTPRDPASPDILTNQALLFHALTQAKEVSS